MSGIYRGIGQSIIYDIIIGFIDTDIHIKSQILIMKFYSIYLLITMLQ